MVTRTERIRGKIAKILNSREVAVNIGHEHGVTSGMVFDILASPGDEVEDPDTGDFLGLVEQAKARVKIKRAYEKFAVATTYRNREVNVGGSGLSLNPLGKLFEPPKWEKRYETLKAKGGFEAASEDLDEKDSYVSVGDPVVQVIDDE